MVSCDVSSKQLVDAVNDCGFTAFQIPTRDSPPNALSPPSTSTFSAPHSDTLRLLHPLILAHLRALNLAAAADSLQHTSPYLGLSDAAAAAEKQVDAPMADFDPLLAWFEHCQERNYASSHSLCDGNENRFISAVTSHAASQKLSGNPCRSFKSPKRAMCHECGQSFAKNSNLKRHIQRYHSDKRTRRVHPCPAAGCHDTFAKVVQLRSHLATRHLDCAKHFVCHVCDRKYKLRDSLFTHQRLAGHSDPGTMRRC